LGSGRGHRLSHLRRGHRAGLRGLARLLPCLLPLLGGCRASLLRALRRGGAALLRRRDDRLGRRLHSILLAGARRERRQRDQADGLHREASAVFFAMGTTSSSMRLSSIKYLFANAFDASGVTAR